MYWNRSELNNILIRYFIICLPLLSGLLVQAQNTLRVRIIDAEENEPLSGAGVKINPGGGAVADLNGYVEVSDIEVDTLQVSVSYVGYKPFKASYTFPLQGIKTIALERFEKLDEVVVTST